MWRTDSLEKTLMLGEDWRQEEKGETGWDGWMASLIRWTWVWAGSGSWWWTGGPGVLQSMQSQRVGHDWGTEPNWWNASLCVLVLHTHTQTHTHMCECVYIYMTCIHTYVHVWCTPVLSHIWLFGTPWTVAFQASLSMGFSRLEILLQRNSPLGNFPNPGTEPVSLDSSTLAGRFFTTVPPGNIFQTI